MINFLIGLLIGISVSYYFILYFVNKTAASFETSKELDNKELLIKANDQHGDKRKGHEQIYTEIVGLPGKFITILRKYKVKYPQEHWKYSLDLAFACGEMICMLPISNIESDLPEEIIPREILKLCAPEIFED